MKFLKSLLGKKEAEEPGLKFRPPEERPAPRRRVAVTEVDAKPAPKEKNPFLDTEFDEMELVNDVTPARVDPYASNAWKYDQDADTRKLKTLHIGKQTEKDKDPDFNPYDTGVFRRGWKD